MNLAIPSLIHVESFLTYLNLEGRVRFTKVAITPLKTILTDEHFILSLFSHKRFFFKSNFSPLLNFALIMAFFGNFINYDSIFNLTVGKLINYIVFFISSRVLPIYNSVFINFFFFNFITNKFFNTLFFNYIVNFFNMDSFCKNSKTLTLVSLKVLDFNFSSN